MTLRRCALPVFRASSLSNTHAELPFSPMLHGSLLLTVIVSSCAVASVSFDKYLTGLNDSTCLPHRRVERREHVSNTSVLLGACHGADGGVSVPCAVDQYTALIMEPSHSSLSGPSGQMPSTLVA